MFIRMAFSKKKKNLCRTNMITARGVDFQLVNEVSTVIIFPVSTLTMTRPLDNAV